MRTGLPTPGGALISQDLWQGGRYRSTSHTTRSLYVREDVIVDALDHWIPTLASPDALADAQELVTTNPQAVARANLKEIELPTRRLVDAIEAPILRRSRRLAELPAQRESTERELAFRPDDRRLTGPEIAAMLDGLGGLAAVLNGASPSEKAEVYRRLGLHLSYQPDSHTLHATADLPGGVSRVGGGT